MIPKTIIRFIEKINNKLIKNVSIFSSILLELAINNNKTINEL